MPQPSPSPSRRETVVVVCLALVLGGGVFLYCLMVLGTWFLALLATCAVVLLVGLGHYLVWGGAMQRATGAGAPSHRIDTGHAERPVPRPEPRRPMPPR
jgi:hypothetical protein